MINLRTARHKAREVAIQNRLRAQLERSLAASVAKEIRRAGRAAADAYEAAGEAALAQALSTHPNKLREVLAPHWRRAMQKFGDRFLEAIGKGRGPAERKDAESLFNRAVQAWITAHAADKVTAIDETTRQNIRRAIDEASAENLGTAAAAKHIRDRVSELSRSRSATIARTEIHAASNAGNVEAAEAAGVAPRKEWISAEDSRTRASHDAADGQVVDKDEPFRVGGARLMHPGDPSGPPEEVINCRCVIGWITREA